MKTQNCDAKISNHFINTPASEQERSQNMGSKICSILLIKQKWSVEDTRGHCLPEKEFEAVMGFINLFITA